MATAVGSIKFNCWTNNLEAILTNLNLVSSGVWPTCSDIDPLLSITNTTLKAGPSTIEEQRFISAEFGILIPFSNTSKSLESNPANGASSLSNVWKKVFIWG